MSIGFVRGSKSRFISLLCTVVLGVVLQGCSLLDLLKPSAQPTSLRIALWCPDTQVTISSISFLANGFPLFTLSSSDSRDLACPHRHGTFVGLATFPFSLVEDVSISLNSRPTVIHVLYALGESPGPQHSCSIRLDNLPTLIALPSATESWSRCGPPQVGVPLLIVTTEKDFTFPIFSEWGEFSCDGVPCFKDSIPTGTSHISVTHIFIADKEEMSFVAQAAALQEGYSIISGTPTFATWAIIPVGQKLSHSYTIRVPEHPLKFAGAWLTVVVPHAGGILEQVWTTLFETLPP
jgi:hypothetical protein